LPQILLKAEALKSNNPGAAFIYIIIAIVTLQPKMKAIFYVYIVTFNMQHNR